MNPVWNSLCRKTPLKRKGGTRFKLTPKDKAQLAWMQAQRPQPCDVCGMQTWSICHVVPRGRGGRIIDNAVWLCENRPYPTYTHAGCHPRQEKRTAAFEAECAASGFPIDLTAIARGHTARWREETGRG